MVMAASICAPLLPTPTANLGSNGGPQDPVKRRAGGHSISLEDAVHLLPTPRATDRTKSGPNQRPSVVQPCGPTTSPNTGPRSSATNSPLGDLYRHRESVDETANDSALTSGSG